MVTVRFIAMELVFLWAAHRFGGPPWAVLGAIAIFAQLAGGVRIASLAVAAPSLAWLALSNATGNRELYFPYAMYLAGCAAVSAADRAVWLGPVGGGVVVAAFVVIRMLQQATVRVLAVECAVAVAILALVLATRGRQPRSLSHPAWHATLATAASLLAYAGLAI